MLFVPVEGEPEIRTVPNALKSFQELVGGYIECGWSRIPRHMALFIVNEEGLIQGLPRNPILQQFCGNVVVVREDGENFGDYEPLPGMEDNLPAGIQARTLEVMSLFEWDGDNIILR